MRYHSNIPRWIFGARISRASITSTKPTGFTVSGAIDDVWVNPQGELMIVDYKSTSKDEKIEALDKEWHDGYKHQMEVYQWLFRRNGFQGLRYGLLRLCQCEQRQQVLRRQT